MRFATFPFAVRIGGEYIGLMNYFHTRRRKSTLNASVLAPVSRALAAVKGCLICNRQKLEHSKLDFRKSCQLMRIFAFLHYHRVKFLTGIYQKGVFAVIDPFFIPLISVFINVRYLSSYGIKLKSRASHV